MNEMKSLMTEIDSMKQLGHHPNIVSMVGCCTRGPRICLIMDFCSLGDLRQYLLKLRPQVRLFFGTVIHMICVYLYVPSLVLVLIRIVQVNFSCNMYDICY